MLAEKENIKGCEILEKVDEGAFGEVYKAYQPLLNREVAVKKILPEYANRTEFIRNFEAEAQRVARLEHPHIVPLYDFWRDPAGAYLIMRWLPRTLHQRLQQGALSSAECLKLIEHIGSALDLTHQYGVIHRDLKPRNILMDETGNFYLADFGIAKDILRQQHTGSGVIKGTLAYIAPEQAQGGTIAPQTDIYSLGVVMFEALTGEHPFRGLTLAEMLAKHLHEPLPDLPANLDMPQVNEVLHIATAKRPTDRYTNIMSFVASFKQALDQTQAVELGGQVSAPMADIPTYIPGEQHLQLRNPYKGLQAFAGIDAQDFFGRAKLVEQLAARLQDDTPYQNFLAIVGPSGSGKSSVVKAGLIPYLSQKATLNAENWLFTEMTPAEHPLEELTSALMQIANRSTSRVLEQLQSDQRGLLWAVSSLLSEDTHLVLVIDQFEELFTTSVDEDEVEQFLDIVRVAVQDKSECVRVIITLRADFMDRPLQYRAFGEVLKQRIEYVLALSGEEIQQAIVQPAQQVGVSVESELVAQIVADIQDEPGALPLLQYTLTELFNERDGLSLTLASYHKLGGVRGALAQRAENLFLTLTETQQDLTRQIFLRLVTLGEGVEDTRRRIKQSELLALVNDVKLLNIVLDIFGRARLLTFDHDLLTREPTIEVAHEALLREWQRLRDWLNDSRHDIRQERILAGATNEWLNNNQDPSYLFSGSRLDQFVGWATETTIALTTDEDRFLQ